MLCRRSDASSGTITASSARLGTVWMMPASAERRLFEPPHTGDRDPERQAHRGGAQQRQQRELQVGGEILRKQRQLLAHPGCSVGASNASTSCASRRGVSSSRRT